MVLEPPWSFRCEFRLAPSRRRQKVAGLWLGNTGLNRSPKARRLKPVGGESIVAPSSRQNPGLLAIALEHQAGHPEERLPEEAPANAAGDLVIDGWVRGLPARFPEKAARVGVEERLPVVEARRSRESMVHGSLIRMRELVHGEGVLCRPPRARGRRGPRRLTGSCRRFFSLPLQSWGRRAGRTR